MRGAGKTSVVGGFKSAVEGIGYVPSSQHLVQFLPLKGSPVVLAVPAVVMSRVLSSRNSGQRNPLVSAFHSAMAMDSSRRVAKLLAHRIRMRFRRRTEARMLAEQVASQASDDEEEKGGPRPRQPTIPEDSGNETDLSSLVENVVDRLRDNASLDAALQMQRPTNGDEANTAAASGVDDVDVAVVATVDED